VALNFPSSPSVGQIFTDSTSGNSYKWTGTYWKSYSSANPATDFDVVNLNVSGVTSTRNLSVTGFSTIGNASVGVVTATEVDVAGVTTSRHLQIIGIATIGAGVTITSGGNINAVSGVVTARGVVSGIVTASTGFISIGNTTPIQITLSGKVLSFTAVGIGSTFFTLS